MSVEPPSSGRPTGPPSGPLSGPSQPPSGPPAQPPGAASSAGAPEPEPHRPWWKSAPRLALLSTAVVAAVALALVLTLPGGGGSGGGNLVFTQAAATTGPDPFTESTATHSSAAPVSAAPSTAARPTNALQSVDGGAEGLYGGTRNVASCDVEKQIKALQADPAKNSAFASVAGVQPAGVPAYLRSLTAVQLRMDTWVTNHGYRDGAATSYQAVLQAGTAVLVDGRGVPRVRCACGNPLTPPVPQQAAPKRTGDTWPSYHPSNVVVVTPAVTVVNVFVLYDPDPGHHWFARHHGDRVDEDRPTRPPVRPVPSLTVITPSASTGPSNSSGSGSPTSPSPCASKDARPPASCPPSSSGSSSPSPSSESPSSSSSSESPSSSSESPSSESPSSESPSSESPSSESPSSASPSSESPSGASPSSASPSAESPSSPLELTSQPETSLSSLPQSADTTSQSAPSSPAPVSSAASPAV
ncbi:hypothetical protein OG562_42510 [Streptomyces sp. NBC_01275]|uniref:DUF6777 domain-containing protein n=1 Tax=Streptomyces sp. NBC_01275 TaxID=2903807 RepID=UPI00224FB6CE|nr:DUF6777 domain-containing protein [Streptomyces sp. NBC_01275]MCX4767513.1 hypothetical protein [Streptomyces sp. NBC_01275]